MKKFRSALSEVDNLNWPEGIIVPGEIAKLLLAADERQRFIAILNGEHRMHCGLIPLGGNYMIYLNQEKRRQWAIELGDELDVELTLDESEFGMPVPEAWRELMEMDSSVDKFFRNLKPGEQRNILLAVGSPKRSETRVKKAIQIGDYLRENNGNFDYRELAAFIKAANAR